MAADITNLTSDAVADPPRFPENTNLKEQIRIQEQKNEKTPPNPEINNDSNKLSDQRSGLENGSGSDDRNSNHEKEQDKKPKSKRKSRKGSSGAAGGTVINNIVQNCTGVNFTFATQTTMNFNSKNGASTSRKDREKSEEICKEMPENIKNLIECDTPITIEDKLIIKKYIGSNWKKVARKLLIKSEVDQCLMDNDGKKVGEVVFQILTVWEQRYPKHAVLGELMKALWSSKEYDCAEQLAIINDPANEAK